MSTARRATASVIRTPTAPHGSRQKHEQNDRVMAANGSRRQVPRLVKLEQKTLNSPRVYRHHPVSEIPRRGGQHGLFGASRKT